MEISGYIQVWGGMGLNEGCHLFDTWWFSRFFTTATPSQRFPVLHFPIFRPWNTNSQTCTKYLLVIVLTCNSELLVLHRKWFASLFWIRAILPINLATSFQFWRKLLFFLRKVTYLGRVRCLLGRRTFYAEYSILRSMRHKELTNQKTGRPFCAPLAHVAPVSCECHLDCHVLAPVSYYHMYCNNTA